ncbi:MAG TPA: CNNM domain-containing protein [Candidatus Saccharimonadales bacterium]|nr:CNNM domain-containing protein [Candidatus Saccharimonadales bacterium]
MNAVITFVITVLLICISAVCSGLNISLMSLEVADLRRKAKLGNGDAAKVLPLRKNGHLSLAAILLTNVAAVSATSLVLESVAGGIIAGITATLLIVIFGEIIPQALFVRHALKFCSLFANTLRTMIFLTYPVSKPLQLLLDRLFEEQEEPLDTRQELGLMITEHLGSSESELDEDEVEIIRGALQLSEKHVREIMTPISQVYWLQPGTVIDGRIIDEIKARGRSRIPILNADKTVCYGILLIKDLVDIDFDDEQPSVDELPLHKTKLVGSMTALDTMFRKFIGAHTHLMLVEREGHIVGIVTIEDLIEEIVGHEIVDETDTP